jgi:hypothetical protein
MLNSEKNLTLQPGSDTEPFLALGHFVIGATNPDKLFIFSNTQDIQNILFFPPHGQCKVWQPTPTLENIKTYPRPL